MPFDDEFSRRKSIPVGSKIQVEGGRNFPEWVDECFQNGWTIFNGLSGRDFPEWVDDLLRNMHQNGEDYYAVQKKNWTWMLSYYYPGTSLIAGSGY